MTSADSSTTSDTDVVKRRRWKRFHL